MAPKKKKKRGDEPPIFSSDCKCLLHKQWSTPDKRALSILKSKKYSSKIIEDMRINIQYVDRLRTLRKRKIKILIQ